MIPRYTDPEMEKIFSEKTKYFGWNKVETAVLRARVAIEGLDVRVPRGLEKKIKVVPAEVDRIEKDITKHDVIAYLMHISPQLPEDLRPHYHRELTSMVPCDTTLFMQLRDSTSLLMTRVKDLMSAIRGRSFEYKNTAMIGRSHGVHAEPLTFGVVLANFYAEFERQLERLQRVKKSVSVGKMSNAVGMFDFDPKIEEDACRRLKIKPIIATQIISRDIIAEYLTLLANIGGSLEKLGIKTRLSQITEIREIQEYFSKDQRGSSAMPHKRNPIGAENISGMARVLRGYSIVGLENQNTWHERDIANSGPERIVIPDASILLSYMLKRMTGIVSKMFVYPKRMAKNLNLTKGLIFSQKVQSTLADKSKLPREEAYGIIKDIAQKCWDNGRDFQKTLLKNPQVRKYLSEEDILSCFNLEEKLRSVDYIFKRVFYE